MRKSLFVTLIYFFSLLSAVAYTPAYTPLRIQERTRTDYESSDGIKPSITVCGDRFDVELFNSNYNDSNDYTTYTFKWYLSYNGKRVSDYFSERMKCRETEKRSVYAWPNKIPAGHAKYVTVQFGEEPVTVKKDRRD